MLSWICTGRWIVPVHRTMDCCRQVSATDRVGYGQMSRESFFAEKIGGSASWMPASCQHRDTDNGGDYTSQWQDKMTKQKEN